MKDFQHLIRVALVFVIVFALFLTARKLMTPASYGKIGRYRAASVDDNKRLPISFAGKAAQKDCADCHEKQVKTKMSNRHKGIACESCHGPLARHVEDPSSMKPVLPDEGEIVKNCVRCHARSISKPPKHPQIDPSKHNAGTACTACHQPHSPRL